MPKPKLIWKSVANFIKSVIIKLALKYFNQAIKTYSRNFLSFKFFKKYLKIFRFLEGIYIVLIKEKSRWL